MNQQRAAFIFHKLHGLRGKLRTIRGNAHIESLAGGHDIPQCVQGLFQRSVRVRTVMVEDVHVVQAHALQGSVQGAHQVLARAAETVGRIIHYPTRLGRDDHFITEGTKIAGEDAAEVSFGGARFRTIVIGQIEMSNPPVIRRAQNLALRGQGTVVAEVLPKAKGNGRQL